MPMFAQLKIADIFGSHMVLQQNTQVPIWGWAKAGDTVRVSCSWLPGQVFTARADAAKRWSVTVPTQTGNLLPRQIELTTGREKILLNDVLIGEVWLCSGQSNMEFQVKESGYTPVQTRASNYPFIRHFKVNHAVSLEPLDTLQGGSWKVCNEQSVQLFSAVAYFFARDLADKYSLPIGIVNSTWGGSQVESWISAEGMRQSDLFKSYVAGFPKTWAEADARCLSKIKKYLFDSDRPNPSPEEEANYLSPDFDVTNWKKVSPNVAWDWQRLWAFRGSGYMALDLDLDEKAIASDAQLKIGHGDLPAALFVNGQQIWTGKNVGGIETVIPATVLKPGKNRLLFQQKLGDSKGWVEMGMRGDSENFRLKTATGEISLAEKWRAMASFNDTLYFVHSSNNLGTAIYNAMIHPISRFPMQGVIWYQGETNAIRAHEYQYSFQLLIQDWRRIWGKEFPFLFVQLANWEADHGTSNTGSEWAELREAQTLALQLPKTGMAVTIDIGDSKDIHPRNKHDVGKRLAHEAMRVAYGEAIQPGSPTKPQIQFVENQVQIVFPSEKQPLVARNKYGYVHGFEVAGEDRIFHFAKAEILGNTILVKSAGVSKPVAVRYAWADDPNDVNLFTAEGFPVAPFRSDSWKCKTEGVRFE